MKVLLACSLLLLAGCSGFSSRSGPEVTYHLRAATAAPPAAASGVALQALSLQVLPVVAAPGLDTDGIVLTSADRRLDRYAGSRWSAPVPRLMASLALDTLRGRGVLAAVHDDASPYQSDYILRISIRRFDADYVQAAGAAPAATVVLDCTVGTRGERRLLGTFVAQASVPASDNRMAAVVAAFERATQQALAAMSEQTVALLAADAAAS
jgi:cholesterol transport system auxiliary component